MVGTGFKRIWHVYVVYYLTDVMLNMMMTMTTTTMMTMMMTMMMTTAMATMVMLIDFIGKAGDAHFVVLDGNSMVTESLGLINLF